MPKVLGVKNGSFKSSEKMKKKKKAYIREYNESLVYYVVSDSVGQNSDEILETTGVPTLFSTSNGATCTDRDLKVIDRVVSPVTLSAAELWEITCKYTTNYDSSRQGQLHSTQQRPRVRWYGEVENRVLEFERRTGNPVTTANQEKILVEGPETIMVLEIVRYEYGPADPQIIFDYSNKVNSEPFWGARPGCALMMTPSTTEVDVEGELLIETTYTIKFRFTHDVEGDPEDDGWAARPLHQGTIVRPAPGEPAEQAKDKHGNPITVNLTDLGIATTDPEFLKFFRHEEIDFNTLSLGPF